jgi:hypothetical protein
MAADSPSNEIVVYDARERILTAPIGLLVATGELVPTRDGKSTRPTQLGHFRFKAGALEQYADAAARALDIYGQQPTSLDDVYLLANDVAAILDIRVKAWGKSGLRVVGLHNFAELPPDEYAAKVDAWDDEFLYRPREVKEVPARLRATWQGESIPGKLAGPDDPRIGRYEMRVEATFRFCLPRVLGMGPVALYATASKHNRDQLYKALTDAHQWLRGNLIGIPFRFRIRPRKTSYFDREKRAYLPTQTFEVVFDTPWTYQEALDAVRENRAALAGGPMLELSAAPESELFADSSQRRRSEAEDQLMQVAAGLQVPGDEDTLTRDEPEAIAMITDAQLNRVARLEEEYGEDTSTLLFGAYGIDRVEQLTEEQADIYENSLRRLIQHKHAPAEPVEIAGEVVEEQTSFDDMLPESVRQQMRGDQS